MNFVAKRSKVTRRRVLLQPPIAGRSIELLDYNLIFHVEIYDVKLVAAAWYNFESFILSLVPASAFRQNSKKHNCRNFALL